MRKPKPTNAPATSSPALPRRSARLSNQELQIIANQSGVMITRYTLSTRTAERFYNAAKIFGLPQIETNMPDSVITKGLIAEESIEVLRSFFINAHNDVPSETIEIRIRVGGGEFRWHRMHYSLVYDKNGEATHAITTAYDITEENMIKMAHDKWKSSFAVMLSESLMYIEVNLTQNCIELLEESRAYGREQGPHSNYDDFVHYGVAHTVLPEGGQDYSEFFNRQRLLGLFSAKVSEDSFVYQIYANKKRPLWVKATVHMTRFPGSDEDKANIAYKDIDAQQCEIARLAQQAAHDPLTGIFNREGLLKAIETRLAHRISGEACALFIIDLDNFKQVNDTFGHQSGDDLLVQTASVLRGIFQPLGLVGRLGGDEFMAFVSGNITRQEVAIMAGKAVNTLQFYTGSSKALSVSSCIGVALSFGEDSFESLYTRADKALYMAKNNGKCQYRFSNESPEAVLNAGQGQSCDELGPLQLQSVMEHLGGGVTVAKMSGPQWQDIEIVYVSPSFTRSLHYTDKVVGEHKEQLLDFIVKADLPGILAAMRRTAHTGKMSECAYRLRSPDTGTLVWRYAHITSMPSGRPDYRLVIGFISDITNFVYNFMPHMAHNDAGMG